MTASAFPSELAYFQETTQGTGPGGAATFSAASWVSSGTRIRHLADSLDPSSIVPTMIDDTRSQETIFGLNQKVIGIENPEFSFSIPLPGSEAAPAVDTQVSATAISTLLTHALGGSDRTNRTFAKVAGTHTTSSIEFDDVTNYEEGAFCAVEDADDAGKLYVRRITDITGDVVTFDEILPFTPVDSDNVWPVIAVHVDETVLCNSAAGPYTLSWYIQKGGASSTETWEVRGTKAQLNTINIVRNELTSADLTIMGSSLLDPTETSEPAFTADPSGNAGVPVGADSLSYLQDYVAVDTTGAANNIHVSDISIDVGVPVNRVNTVTEVETGMQGTRGFTTSPGDTMITLNLVPFADTHWTDFTAGTYKTFRWAKIAAAGAGFGVHVSRAEIVESPARSTSDAASSAQVILRAHRDLANANATDANLWTSKITLLFY